ncbi:type I restriction and modification enzyme subunit R-like protein [Flavobacterium sp. 9]|uniref:N-6 DNA methylase n=1 Tax=Flavobacterium sp. 9 TaxID=2035198 RepID=UPI000C1A06BA|nr:N-6 DNA methylase [Flavobacterium sp. 9]PIF33566.1 type I restriction and modification enzyme subunit R-like protein [Flavobacterium sp. 9]
MEQELQLFRYVKKYLEDLGYPSESIFFEYPTDNRNRIDVVVKKEDGIYIVIEVKNRNSLNLQAIDDIEYHPLTRRVQKEAQEVNAEYFVLTNGYEYLWMKTGVGGRPEKVEEVIYSAFNVIKNTEKQFFNIVLNHVFEYLKSFPITGNRLYDISIIIYGKLKKEINYRFDLNDIEYNYFINNEINYLYNRKYSDREIISDAIERLESINLLENNLTVIEFIDDLFLKNSKDLIIPRWLTDLMVKILNPNKEDKIVDMFARNGSFSSSIYFNENENVLSYYTNTEYYYWIKIQQLLFLKRETEIILEPTPINGKFKFSGDIPKSFLIAPPFNVKVANIINEDYDYRGIKDSTSLFIENALNSVGENGKVVVIVPDSFLSSNQFLKFRKYIINNNSIDSIISLPQDSFKPYSSVKTTLLTIIKGKKNVGTFFATLEDSPKEYLIDCSKFENIHCILTNLAKFRSSKEVDPSKLGFIVDDVNFENLHFSKYLFTQNLDEEDFNKNYIFIPLKELSYNIFRGDQLVSDKIGDIPYIGPASVRRMRIVEDGFSYTSKKLIPKKSIKTEFGQILINAIGPNRGKAALVTSEYSNMFINRHIIGLKVKENLVLPEYLAIAINSKIVQEQFLDKSSGSVIPSLNFKSLEEIIIPLPSIEIQEKTILEFNALSEEYGTALVKISNLESELNEKLNTLGREEKKI